MRGTECSDGPLHGSFAPGFQNRLRHFLDEQGNAIGALDDVLPNVRRKQVIADDAVDHRADVALRQSIKREGSDIRASDPGRIELWSERNEQQHAKARESGR